jgi:hypothetical protein
MHRYDHLTGECVSPFCSNCSLQLTNQNITPVFMQSLNGYDGHGDCGTGLVSNNEELLISFGETVWDKFKIKLVNIFIFLVLFR